MAMESFGGSKQRMLSEINVTPLVDVMLVLLIIFMVTTPLLEQGIAVNLPQTVPSALQPDQKQITLTLTKKKELFLAQQKIQLSELSQRLKLLVAADVRREVFVRADENVPYGFVAQVMAEMRMSGIQRIGLVTIPLSGKP